MFYPMAPQSVTLIERGGHFSSL